MNTLSGQIEKIAVKGSLSLVRVRVQSVLLSAIVIDTPDTTPYLQEGNTIQVIFKESEVIIGLGTSHPVSLQNKLPGRIQSIDSGELLSKLYLDTTVGKITSIITTNAVKQLQLEAGMEITAMIKTNEMMLSE